MRLFADGAFRSGAIARNIVTPAQTKVATQSPEQEAHCIAASSSMTGRAEVGGFSPHRLQLRLPRLCLKRPKSLAYGLPRQLPTVFGWTMARVATADDEQITRSAESWRWL